MASEAVNYIRDVIDTILHGKANKKKKDAAMAEIDEFIAGYDESKVPEKPTLPDVPSYTRMEYEAPDDDALKARAEEGLAAYKAQGEQGIDREIEAMRKQYEAQTAAAKESHEQAARETEESYAAAKEDVNNDMLKRGLARSSVAANKQAQISQSEAKAKSDLAAAYEREVRELGEKINALGVQREQALNDFDLSYATKLSARIDELKKERDDKMSEVLKYNNSLAEKEHAAMVDKQMKESDLYSEALAQAQKENGLQQRTSADYAAIYAAIAQSLRAVNGADARDMVLNNPAIRANLDSTYYYKLYDEFCR